MIRMDAMKGIGGARTGANRAAYGHRTAAAASIREGYAQRIAGAIRARFAIGREGARRQFFLEDSEGR